MFWAINKPKNISSFKAIREFQKLNNINKIGHAGTLDPLASGLLIVATDADTKLLSYILAQDKEYITTAQLWASSDSWDTETPVTELPKFKITKDEVLSALEYLKNLQSQQPPSYSAKKVNGVRAYKLARKNEAVSLTRQKIKIHSIDLIDYDAQNGIVVFKTKVSKGTYIRSMVHDLGKKLNTEAVMSDLYRTKIGNISLKINQKSYQIVNFEKLFGILTYALNENQLISLEKNKTFSNNQKIIGKRLLLFNNDIVGIANIENDNVEVIKIFWPKVLKIFQKGEIKYGQKI